MEIDEVSHLLFGRGIRLPLAAWVLETANSGPFYQQQAADGIGAKAQYLRPELQHLCDLGMIEQQDKAPGQIRQMYTVDAEHPLWAIITTAVDSVALLKTR